MTKPDLIWWWTHIAFWLAVIGVPIYALCLILLPYPRKKETSIGEDVFRLLTSVATAFILAWYLWM